MSATRVDMLWRLTPEMCSVTRHDGASFHILRHKMRIPVADIIQGTNSYPSTNGHESGEIAESQGI
jgi:hypothetical protein